MLTKEMLENLENFLSIHALADFPEDILDKIEQEEGDTSYLADFPEELELGFH